MQTLITCAVFTKFIFCNIDIIILKKKIHWYSLSKFFDKNKRKINKCYSSYPLISSWLIDLPISQSYFFINSYFQAHAYTHILKWNQSKVLLKLVQLLLHFQPPFVRSFGKKLQRFYIWMYYKCISFYTFEFLLFFHLYVFSNCQHLSDYIHHFSVEFPEIIKIITNSNLCLLRKNSNVNQKQNLKN